MKFNEIRKGAIKKNPLVHCITNPISINQCANVLLAAGARPIMAEHPNEVCEITASAESLLLNLGNITDVRMKSMLLSARTAVKNDIPFAVDAVGTACSSLRRRFLHKLLKKFKPSIIKGNYSEITALLNDNYRASGVDSQNFEIEEISKTAVFLSKKYSTIILASGKTDVITDGKKIVYVKNGVKQLSSVTGTGCMLGALCSAYMSVCRDIDSAACACAVMGICGELSENKNKNASFLINLIDNLSSLSDDDFEKYLNLEEIEIEKI